MRDFQLIVSVFRIATVSITATGRLVQGDAKRLLVLQDCHKRLSTSKQVSLHETCTSYFIITAGKKLLTNTIIISLNPTHSSLTSLLHHEERKCKKLHNRQQISSSGYAKYTTKASLELEFCYQHLHSRSHMTNNLEKTRQSSIVTSLDTDNRNLVGFRVYCSRTKD